MREVFVVVSSLGRDESETTAVHGVRLTLHGARALAKKMIDDFVTSRQHSHKLGLVVIPALHPSWLIDDTAVHWQAVTHTPMSFGPPLVEAHGETWIERHTVLP